MISSKAFLRASILLLATGMSAAYAQSFSAIPFIDSIGLYENSSNKVPSDHAAVGRSRAAEIKPLDTNGLSSDSGKIVLLSIGMSNASMEWCGSGQSCLSATGNSFMAQVMKNTKVNRSTLEIVNGAESGQTAFRWTSPADVNYDMVRDTRLTPRALSENQVQVVWLKNANPSPTVSLPSANADAYVLENKLASTVRALRVRYPNLKLVFLSSRIYGGYAVESNLNPEPFAYESGYSVKWLIQAQMAQMRNGGIPTDIQAGDLNYNTVSPWIAWGPYLWANGSAPRSDGFFWSTEDFNWDNTHPSTLGIGKVGSLLLGFFSGSPFTCAWFNAGGCSPPVVIRDVAVRGMKAPASVKVGATADIWVEVENAGTVAETFLVTLTDLSTGRAHGVKSVFNLAPGASQTLNFSWGTMSAAATGNHNLSASVAALRGEVVTDNNALGIVVNVTP